MTTYEKLLNLIRDFERLYCDAMLESNIEGPGDMRETYRAISTLLRNVVGMAEDGVGPGQLLRAMEALTTIARERHPE